MPVNRGPCGEMSFLSQKVQIFDIWIYLYNGFRLPKRETGRNALFILDRLRQVFQMKRYRRLLNISYKDHVTNEEGRRKIEADIAELG